MRTAYLLPLLLLLLHACDPRPAAKAPKPAPEAVVAKRPRPLWDATNPLLPEVRTLRLRYIAFGCGCAHWRIEPHKGDTAGTGKEIWLEPASEGLPSPEMDSDFFERSGVVLATGQFYERESFPRGAYEQEDQGWKAPVFRYSAIRTVPRKRSRNKTGD